MNATSILVKDANGNLQTINTALNPGAAPSAASSPVVLATDQSRVPVSDAESAPFSDWPAITLGGAIPAGMRSIGVLCTLAGNVSMLSQSGNVLTVPVFPGWQTFPLAPSQIELSGTTATATFFALI